MWLVDEKNHIWKQNGKETSNEENDSLTFDNLSLKDNSVFFSR